MHRVWITPTSSAAAGMVQGMAPYSGSWMFDHTAHLTCRVTGKFRIQFGKYNNRI